MTTARHIGDRTDEVPWHSLSVTDAASLERRLVEHEPNEQPSEPYPNIWAVAGAQLANITTSRPHMDTARYVPSCVG